MDLGLGFFVSTCIKIFFIKLSRHTVDHPNLEMAMTVSYISSGIDGSQCAYQCLTADKKNWLKLLFEFSLN